MSPAGPSSVKWIIAGNGADQRVTIHLGDSPDTVLAANKVLPLTGPEHHVPDACGIKFVAEEHQAGAGCPHAL